MSYGLEKVSSGLKPRLVWSHCVHLSRVTVVYNVDNVVLCTLPFYINKRISGGDCGQWDQVTRGEVIKYQIFYCVAPFFL